jgi:hydrogenase maturation factor
MVNWAVEWGAGGALSADAVKNDTLKPGDKVIVTGNPARDTGSHRLRMRSIERPADGWKWAGTFG